MATDIWSELLRLMNDAVPPGLGYLAYKTFPGLLAIATAEKGERARVCLEVMRLRRKDAKSIPSYLEQRPATEKPENQVAVDLKELHETTKAIEAPKPPPPTTAISPPNRTGNRRPRKPRHTPDRDLGG